jgi:diacylglycerol kinase family enzyme
MPERVCVFLNDRSGRSGTGPSPRAVIEHAFHELGVPCDVVLLRPRDPIQRLVHKAAQTPGIVIAAAGGDGTISSIAAALATLPAHSRPPLGVFPTGTLNHFAKDLGIPQNWNDAAKLIAQGTPRPIDLGEVNGHYFVNNSSLGFYPGMVLERERLRRVGLNKWLSLVIASARAFLRFRHITLCVTPTEGPPITCSTPFLFIGNNEYTMEGSAAGSRPHLDRGRLYLYMAPSATRLSLIRLTANALLGRPHSEPHFKSLCVTSSTVELKRRIARIALDGEIVRVKPPIHYAIRPAAIMVIAPEPTP